MICHCDACNYIFNAAVIRSKYAVPTRCPSCGKKTVGYHMPAVRVATEDEIQEYENGQRLVLEKICEEDDLNGRL